MQVVTQTLAIWNSVIEKADVPDEMPDETKQAFEAAVTALTQTRDQLQVLGPQIDEVMHQGNTLALRMQNTLIEGQVANGAADGEAEADAEEVEVVPAAKAAAD